MTRQEYKQLNEKEQREARKDLIIGIASLAFMVGGMILIATAAKVY